MIKYIIPFLCALACYATPLQDKIANFLPKNVYQKNANFIKKIFSNEKNFYTNGNLNIPAILSSLKSNGLLTLKLASPSNISATFRINEYKRTDDNPSFTFLNYSTSSMLTNMGYTYFYLTNVKKQKDKISITYTMNSESNIDPAVLVAGLIARGYKIMDVNRYSNTHWIYDISLQNALAPDSDKVDSNTQSLSRISGKYWLSFSGAGLLTIKPKDIESFYPKVLVFNKDMNIVYSIMDTDSTNAYKIRISSDIRYIMVTDNYNPTNLRNGIDIDFKVEQ